MDDHLTRQSNRSSDVSFGLALPDKSSSDVSAIQPDTSDEHFPDYVRENDTSDERTYPDY